MIRNVHNNLEPPPILMLQQYMVFRDYLFFAIFAIIFYRKNITRRNNDYRKLKKKTLKIYFIFTKFAAHTDKNWTNGISAHLSCLL